MQPEFALARSPSCDRRHDTVVSVQRRYDRRASRTRSLPGTRLAIGSAVIEVSAKPHVGCWKYEARFGRDATRFVNSKVGRALRLRGFCGSIIVGGTVRIGDKVRKVPVLEELPGHLP